MQEWELLKQIYLYHRFEPATREPLEEKIARWMETHPDFVEAMRRGGDRPSQTALFVNFTVSRNLVFIVLDPKTCPKASKEPQSFST